jgi:hypothetical protein
MTRHLLIQGVLAGVFATFVMDLSLVAGKLAGFIRAPFPLPLGRWAANVARGRMFHSNILETPKVPAEGPVTLATHYVIGAGLGTCFVALAPQEAAGASFLGGVAFGTGTSLLPWLLMFPAMGFGLFGRRGPERAHLLRNSLYTHVAFGLGLGAWAAWLRPLL